MGKPLAGLPVKAEYISRWHVAGLKTIELAAVGKRRVPADGKVSALPAINWGSAADWQQGFSSHRAC